VAEWTFLTHHAQVLLCVARESDNRLSRIADAVGITERATHRIVSDLVDAGYLTRHRLGRQSFYEVHAGMALRHPVEAGAQVGDLLRPFLRRGEPPVPAAPSGVPATGGESFEPLAG
jgi:DNA-binding IclR family transcriptional regulator